MYLMSFALHFILAEHSIIIYSGKRLRFLSRTYNIPRKYSFSVGEAISSQQWKKLQTEDVRHGNIRAPAQSKKRNEFIFSQ